MGDFDIIKAIAGLFSALGAIAVYKYNLSQSNKVRAELIEKLDVALSEQKKHVACEIFKMLYGLRMDYLDIHSICNDDRVSKIIHALQKSPGLITHENGQLKFTQLYEKQWVRITKKNRDTPRIYLYFRCPL